MDNTRSSATTHHELEGPMGSRRLERHHAVVHDRRIFLGFRAASSGGRILVRLLLTLHFLDFRLDIFRYLQLAVRDVAAEVQLAACASNARMS